MRLNRQFIVFGLLLGWFSLQISALNHEYSHEHNHEHNSNAGHHCIAHFALFDDIIPTDSTPVTFKLNIISGIYFSAYQSALLKAYYFTQQSRAPPQIS